MKLFVNQKIKALFQGILLCALFFTLTALLIMGLGWKNQAVVLLICFWAMTLAILLLCYRYFREQHEIMEHAIDQMRAYLAGNQEASLACDDEGELYRLFHEVNALAAVLNAHVEREKDTKRFLKNTISDISHQLKTPLAALEIYNGIIQEAAEDFPDIREFSMLSEQELDRIECLVQSLLKITKLDAGTIVPDKTWENLAELAGAVRKQFLFRAEQEGKELCLQGGEETVFFCDRIWITEALSNLVKNALDHTEPGDQISIEWKSFASVVQITVRDTGSGIHPEDLPHIFKRFYRSRYSQDIQGVGLGLSLVKAIVEAHQGTVEADSSLGRGSDFTMNFLAGG